MTAAAQRLHEEAARCIKCGFCEAVCPTLPSAGYQASKGARGRVLLADEMLERIGRGESLSGLGDSFYSCLDCYACYEVCPAGVNAGKVSHYAKEIIAESDQGVPDMARLMEKNIMRFGSLLPLGKRAASWSRGLELPATGDTLLYTGQMYQLMSFSSALTGFLRRRGELGKRLIVGSSLKFPWLMKLAVLLNDRQMFDEMNNSLRNIAYLLKLAGIRFCYMGADEPYPGTLMFDLGFEASSRAYATAVTDEFRRRAVRRIITVDPHTHDILANTYPSLVPGFDFEVVHYTELLGSLKFSKTGRQVTYHEPCHLSRRFDSLSAPSDLLGRAADISLPDRHGRRTHCCGGPDELLFPEISSGVTATRTAQLAEAGNSMTVTACPVCLLNLRHGGEVADMSQLLVESAAR